MLERRSRRAAVAALAVGVALPLIATPTASADHEGAPALPSAVPEALKPIFVEARSTCSHLPPGLLSGMLGVESGFDAGRVAENGATGLAQLTPGTWAAWGMDANHDGDIDALDPYDAIHTAARLMCHLYRRAVSSTVAGDRLSLAIAAYHIGWTRIAALGSLERLPLTASHVARVKALAARFVPPPSRYFGDGSAVALGRYPANPRTPAAAASWARAARGSSDNWYMLCLRFVARSYGWGYSGTPHAIDHWTTQIPLSMRHPRDRNAPVGALLFWDTGQRSGHVALALGDGYVATNDIYRAGAISVVHASEIERIWGARYLGWAAPYFPEGSFY
ncbi:MAG: lytic transglycosylase domain-containing protein [Sporichthyaceae bacterium]